MVKKIIISYFNNIAVIVQGNKVQQIIVVNQTYQMNDIYIGKVDKIFSSMNAAFIDLGHNHRSGFIHMSDLKSLKKNVNSFSINDIISVNQIVLVQVIKEPTGTKGPRLTSNIHLHGKYVVLMPLCNVIFISSRVYNTKERLYLYSLAMLIKPRQMGLLIKHSANGVSESLILQDLDSLLKQWAFLQKKFISTDSPLALYKDEDLVKKVIRDIYEKNVSKIIVDTKNFLNLLYYYLKQWSYISPSIKTKLYLYNNQFCLLERFCIKRVIKNALKSKVNLWYGGYLFIQTYEALTVIDVNSGSFNKLSSSRDTILRINIYAAIEISYQLRLRNINGVIIIDFIDMSSPRDKLKLIENFNKLLIDDDCSPTIIQLSDLGLLELTRRRKNQSLREIFHFSSKKNMMNLTKCSQFELSHKFFFSISNKYVKYKYLTNKNIKHLFFNKSFSRNNLLKNKSFYLSFSLIDRYFFCLGSVTNLCFFYPKANYIVPLFIYTKFAKCQMLYRTN
uniref:Ribonuclease E n=1 Tax=Tolypiocladia glomerulata TaxID=860646 RepID=A0A1Z1MUA1_9FLOR|nr:ribonuclease E [Tolypiocladia glomerulata]ARW69663.1 ribonuclease E [Tolypiocladia glomerulata]